MKKITQWIFGICFIALIIFCVWCITSVGNYFSDTEITNYNETKNDVIVNGTVTSMRIGGEDSDTYFLTVNNKEINLNDIYGSVNLFGPDKDEEVYVMISVGDNITIYSSGRLILNSEEVISETEPNTKMIWFISWSLGVLISIFFLLFSGFGVSEILEKIEKSIIKGRKSKRCKCGEKKRKNSMYCNKCGNKF